MAARPDRASAEADREPSELEGEDATLLRRLSRNISLQSGAVSSVFKRAFTGLRRSDNSSSEQQTEPDLEAGTSNASPSGTPEQLRERTSAATHSSPASPAVATPFAGTRNESASSAPATGDPNAALLTTERTSSAPANTEISAVEAVQPASTPSPAATTHSIFGRLLRTSSGGLAGKGSGGQQPVCLICLENLGPDDFESGEAMQLECQCRGELAMRHRVCAEKWSRVKGDRICDVCKATITNLPEITPRAPHSAGSDNDPTMFEDADGRDHAHGLHGPYLNDQIPGSADVIFDCIRVTWVAMIICILFFEMNLAMALWTGLIVGLAYTGFARAMYRTQLAAIQREMARDRERATHGNVDSPAPPMVVVV